MQSNNTRAILRITGLYALVAVAWITFSDRLLIKITANPASITAISTFKGWGFVLVTSSLLFLLLRYEFSMRSKAEQARQQSEALYRELADSITDIFFALDFDLRYIYWNKASEQFTSLPATYALGKSLDDLFPGTSQTAVGQMYRRVLSARSPETMINPFQFGPNKRYFEVSAYPSAIGVFVYAKDITERWRHDREMETIATTSLKLRSISSRDQIQPIILKQILDFLDSDGAAIALPVPDTRDLIIQTGAGKSEPMAGFILPIDGSIMGQVYQNGELYNTPDVFQYPRLLHPDLVSSPAVACLPLVITGQSVIGVLWINRSQPFTDEDLRLLKIIGDLAAHAIHRTAMLESLQKSNQDLNHAYDETIRGWSRALDLRDHETEGHTARVTDLTLRLARSFGLSEPDLVHVRRGALLHDIGKMGVPDAILNKPGPLDQHEWEIMRLHPVYAYRLLLPIAYLRPALDIPYCHHERWDGSGYPRGLRGEEIPLAARIFALADVWDGLSSNRPYRPARTRTAAAQYIRDQSGKYFDPRLVELFQEYINQEV